MSKKAQVTPFKTANFAQYSDNNKSYRSLSVLVEPEVLSEIQSGRKENKTLRMLQKEKIFVFIELRNEDISESFEEAIKALGGKISKVMTKSTTLMITNQPSCKKVQKALELGIPIVGLLWLTESITAQTKLDLAPYLINPIEFEKSRKINKTGTSRNAISNFNI